MATFAYEQSLAGTRVGAAGDRMGLLQGALVVLDVVMMVGAVFLAWELRLTFDVWDKIAVREEALALTAGPWIIAGWLALLATHRAYSRQLLGVGPEEFRAVFTSSLLAAGTVGLFCYLATIELSRGFLLLTFIIGTPALLLERYATRKTLHRLRAGGYLLDRVIAVGGVAGVHELATVLQRSRYAGYEVVGACLPTRVMADAAGLSVPVLGPVERTRAICLERGAQTVLVARGAYGSSAELQRFAWDLADADINLVVVPDLTDVAGPRIRMRPVGGLPLLHVDSPRVSEAGGIGKRLFDVLGAAVLLAFLLPWLLLVAVVIKAADGGPVLFRQTRVGRDGARFEMLKLRTMVVDAEELLDHVRHLNVAGSTLFKAHDDPRVTAVGRWLRRYSIDELPQLVNVLRGEMSLVGPRPPLTSEVSTYGNRVRRRLLVRPGMTGLWQVSGRSDLGWAESVRLDLYYVDNWSMMSDLVIMAKTVRTVVTSDGAY